MEVSQILCFFENSQVDKAYIKSILLYEKRLSIGAIYLIHYCIFSEDFNKKNMALLQLHSLR